MNIGKGNFGTKHFDPQLTYVMNLILNAISVAPFLGQIAF